MGNQPSVGQTESLSFHFHTLVHSPEAVPQDLGRLVVFPPAPGRSRVAYFNKALSTVERGNVVSLKLQVHFSEGSVPVVGFGPKAKNLSYLDIRRSPGFYFWDLVSGRLFANGSAFPDVSLPCCHSGDVIQCRLDMGVVGLYLEVVREGRVCGGEEVRLEGVPGEAWPLVGVMEGEREVSFRLLSFGQTSNILQDLTLGSRFDCSTARGEVEVLDRAVVRTDSQKGNTCVLINRVMRSDLHCWRLRVCCDFGASICFGVAAYPFTLDKEFLEDSTKHIYRHLGLTLWRSYHGLLYRNGKKLDYSLEPLGWQHGDSILIDLRLDLNEGTLEIFKGGKSLGIAFKNLSGPLMPVVAFYAAYEKRVELVSYHTTQRTDDRHQEEEEVAVRVVKDSPVNSSPHLPMEKRLPIVTSEKSKLPEKNTISASGPPDSQLGMFIPATIFGELSLSEDCLTVYRSKGQSGNAYCLLGEVGQPGEYHYVFIVQNDQGASLCVGVARKPIQPAISASGNIYTSPSMWLFRSFQGMLYAEGKEIQKRYEEFWVGGTLLEMVLEVDEENAVLQYLVNGQEQGVPFSKIPLPVHPVVAFYASMEKRVSLIHFEFKPKVPSALNSSMKSSLECNRVDTLESHAPRDILPVCNPLAREGSLPQCLVCGADNNVIALPCQHASLCPDHMTVVEFNHCQVCSQPISGMWNILCRF